MKVGDLVKFKVHHYHKSYGLGVVLGACADVTINDFKASRRPRLRVMFGGEQIVARFEELEIVNESR